MLVWMCLDCTIFFVGLAFLATFVTFFLLTKMEDGTTGADRDRTNVKRDLADPSPNVRWREMGVLRPVEEASVELVKSIVAIVNPGGEIFGEE